MQPIKISSLKGVASLEARREAEVFFRRFDFDPFEISTMSLFRDDEGRKYALIVLPGNGPNQISLVDYTCDVPYGSWVCLPWSDYNGRVHTHGLER